jgi:hypothetical protein
VGQLLQHAVAKNVFAMLDNFAWWRVATTPGDDAELTATPPASRWVTTAPSVDVQTHESA